MKKGQKISEVIRENMRQASKGRITKNLQKKMEMGKKQYQNQHWNEVERKYKNQVYDMRINKKYSYKKIGEIFGFSGATIKRWAQKWEFYTSDLYKNIKGKNNPNYRSYHIDKNKLADLYINQNKNTRECAKILKISQVTIWRHLHRFNIPIHQRPEKIKVNCMTCGKEKRVYPSNFKDRKYGFFCSDKCKGVWIRNKYIGEKNPRWNGGLTKIYCNQCGKIIKRYKSRIDNYKQQFCNNECLALYRKGKKLSKETIKKLRLIHLKRIKEQIDEGGQMIPFYNSKACKFFEHFDEVLNTQGQYAINGGEYYIKELGYWVDYINSDWKIIIEWDEESHYKNGELKEKDVRREREIQEALPDYDIFRIREKVAEYHSLPA
jgi:transposase